MPFSFLEMGFAMDDTKEDVGTYVSVLHSSLRKKLDVMKRLLELTREQEEILDANEFDVDGFDRAVGAKQDCLDEISELDRGFQSVFDRVGPVIKANIDAYRSQVVEMQNFIRTISGVGMEIEAVERKNKEKFNKFLYENRSEIKEFKKSNKTAATYYQNMSNQHREWQSYFFDSKK